MCVLLSKIYPSKNGPHYLSNARLKLGILKPGQNVRSTYNLISMTWLVPKRSTSSKLPIMFRPLPRGRAVSHHDNHFSCLWKHDQHSQCIPWTLLSVSCAHLTFQVTDHAVGKRQHTNIGTQTDIDSTHTDRGTEALGHRDSETGRYKDSLAHRDNYIQT